MTARSSSLGSADDARRITFPLRTFVGSERRVSGHARGHEDFDALRAADHVGVGDDVAFGIDDYAGADGAAAADDHVGLAALAVFGGAVAGDQDLHHAGETRSTRASMESLS